MSTDAVNFNVFGQPNVGVDSAEIYKPLDRDFGLDEYFRNSASIYYQNFNVDSAVGALAVNRDYVAQKAELFERRKEIYLQIRESAERNIPKEERAIFRDWAILNATIKIDLERARLRMRVLEPATYDSLPTPPFDQGWLLTKQQMQNHKNVAREIKDRQKVIDEITRRLPRAGARFYDHQPEVLSKPAKMLLTAAATIGSLAVVAKFATDPKVHDLVRILYTEK